MLAFQANGSDEQTRAVVKAIIEGADDTPPAPDLGPWHALDRWLGRSR